MQGAGMAAISATIAVVILVVGIDIVSTTLATANGSSGFTGIIETVTDNIPVFMAIGGLIVAVGWAVL